MNKGRILALIILLVIAGLSVFFFRRKIFKENNLEEFAVKDTASITRIFLADKNGHQSTLDKTADGKWRVNGKYDVQESKMQTLMDAFYRIRVKSPVPAKDRDDVIKILTTSVKVMIYKGDELLKVYYVGSETRDYLGTYMCIENAEEPMITEIPGFNGFLTPRYLTREEDWKSNAIMSCRPGSISMVKVDYDRHPEISFTITNDEKEYSVRSNDPKIKDIYSNQERINEYLALYENLSMEGYDNRATTAFNDSLQSARPFVTIDVVERDKNETVIKVFFKILPPGNERLDEHGKPTNIDPDRYYAVTNKDTKVMVVQIPNFGRVMQRFDFFK